MGSLLKGKFAQTMELLSIVLLLIGVVSLCQPYWHGLFRAGFTILIVGWIGLTIFSHRSPVR